jgi:uncharacterized delta-60 repeat protein
LRPGVLGAGGFATALAASTTVFAAHARAAPGAFDPSWGRGGIATAPFPGLDAELISIARLPGGGVVAAGRVEEPAAMARGAGDVALARFVPSGRLDPSFGANGTVRTRLTGRDRVVRVLAQRDGRLLVVVMNGYLPHYEFGKPPVRVLRYRSDGRLDRSYGGGDGIAEVRTGRPVVRDAVIQGDVAVLLVPTRRGHMLVRLSPTGRVDWVVRTPVNPVTSRQLPALAPAPNGDIVLAGTMGLGRGAFVARYDARGRLVRSYPRPASVGFCPQAAAAGRDGSVVLAGPEKCGGVDRRRGILFVRYGADGRRDPRFGREGVASLLLRGGNDYAEHRVHMRVLPSGAIVVAALPTRVVNVRVDDSTTYSDTVEPDVGVFRLTRRGVPDRSFAPDGETRFDVSPGAALTTEVAGLEITPGGRILVGASAQPALPIVPAQPRAFTVVRLRGGGARARALSLRVRQVNESGAEHVCGRNRQTACPFQLGPPLRIAGRIAPVPRAAVGASVSVRLFGAYWQPSRDVYLEPFAEVNARVGRDGTFLALVPTRSEWYAGYAQVQAHLTATTGSYDVRSPLRHVRMRR